MKQNYQNNERAISLPGLKSRGFPRPSVNNIENMFASQLLAGKDKLFFKLMDGSRLTDIKWYPSENLSELTAELFNLTYLELSDGVPMFQKIVIPEEWHMGTRLEFVTTWLDELPSGIERLNHTVIDTKLN
jgi:hypothetical protein